MRIGQQAYTSPAGDIVAFALALGMVIAAASALNIVDYGSNGVGEVDHSILSIISLWRGWDRDGDGKPELSSMMGIMNGTSQPPGISIDDPYIVVIESDVVEWSPIFSGGRLLDGEYRVVKESSVSRSLMILIEDGSTTHPARMSVAPLSEVIL